MDFQLLYFPIFFIMTLLFVTIKCIPTPTGRLLSPTPPQLSFNYALLLGIIYILYFGLRPTAIYTSDGTLAPIGDTPVYVSTYNNVALGIFPEDYGYVSLKGDFRLGAFLFYIIQNTMALSGFSSTIWLIVNAIIYILPCIFALRLLTPRYVLVGFVFIIVSFGFYGFGVNGMKNGEADSIFLLGLTIIATKYYSNKRLTRIIPGLLVCCSAYLFHSSILMAIGALIASLTVVRTTKGAIAIWILAIIVTLIFGNSLALFANTFYEDEKLADYVNGSNDAWASQIRFRWDFLIYSALPIIMGWYVTVKKKIKDARYQLILNTYILANSIFVIFIYSSFPNRFAAVSWSILPIVLYYPLVKYNLFGNNQNTYAGAMLYAQMALLLVIS